MKIIFLDIDGVLNPLHYENALYKMWKATDGEIKSKDKYGALFFDQNVQALYKIIGATGASNIVLSSTWRMSGIEAIKSMWVDRGLPGEIIGVTLILRKPESNIRGHEINEWLFDRSMSNCSYCIIDDNDDMLPHQKYRFVQTNSHVGLTMADAQKAIQILNK